MRTPFYVGCFTGVEGEGKKRKTKGANPIKNKKTFFLEREFPLNNSHWSCLARPPGKLEFEGRTQQMRIPREGNERYACEKQ
jgi:hypothetical protein